MDSFLARDQQHGSAAVRQWAAACVKKYNDMWAYKLNRQDAKQNLLFFSLCWKGDIARRNQIIADECQCQGQAAIQNSQNSQN